MGKSWLTAIDISTKSRSIAAVEDYEKEEDLIEYVGGMEDLDNGGLKNRELPIYAFRLLGELSRNQINVQDAFYFLNNIQELVGGKPIKWFEVAVDLGLDLFKLGILPCPVLGFGVPLALNACEGKYKQYLKNIEYLKIWVTEIGEVLQKRENKDSNKSAQSIKDNPSLRLVIYIEILNLLRAIDPNINNQKDFQEALTGQLKDLMAVSSKDNGGLEREYVQRLQFYKNYYAQILNTHITVSQVRIDLWDVVPTNFSPDIKYIEQNKNRWEELLDRSPPIALFDSITGTYYLVDGNHSVIIALLGSKLPAIPASLFALFPLNRQRLIDLEEFIGNYKVRNIYDFLKYLFVDKSKDNGGCLDDDFEQRFNEIAQEHAYLSGDYHIYLSDEGTLYSLVDERSGEVISEEIGDSLQRLFHSRSLRIVLPLVFFEKISAEDFKGEITRVIASDFVRSSLFDNGGGAYAKTYEELAYLRNIGIFEEMPSTSIYGFLGEVKSGEVRFEITGDSAKIHNFYVYENKREKGVGFVMWKKALELFRESNIVRIEGVIEPTSHLMREFL
jgi:hypothetical protein